MEVVGPNPHSRLSYQMCIRDRIISNKAASFASMELARYALERADKRASSILEQYLSLIHI